MIRFSKVWCVFTEATMNLVTIFMVGIVRLSLAQTTQDSVVKKDKLSRDTTKEARLFGIGGILESLNSNLELLTLIVTSVGVVFVYLQYRSTKQSSNPDVSGTSAGFVKSFENRWSTDKKISKIKRDPDPSPTDKAILRAYEFQKEGKIDKAIEEWQNVVKITEGENNSLAAVAWFSIGYLHIMKNRTEETLSSKENRTKEALSAYDKAINLADQYVAAYYYRGSTKRDLGEYKFERGDEESAFEYFESAIADYSDAIQLKSDFAEAYTDRGFTKTILNQHKAASMDYKDAIKLKTKDNRAYTGLAEVELHFERYESAIAHHNKSIRIERKDPIAYISRGNTRVAFGKHESDRGDEQSARNQFESAIKDYTTAINLQPDFAIPYSNRGTAKLAFGKHESDRGDEQSARNQFESAIKDHTTAINLQRNFTKAYANRGTTQIRLGHIEMGREDFQTALDLARKRNQVELEIDIERQIIELDNIK